MSRVCGSIAATRWGVKACCMRARTRVCFGGSSRSSVSILVSSSAPGTGWERSKAAENVLKSRRIASHSAHRRNPSEPKRLHAAERSFGAQLGQQPVALNGEIGVAKVENRQCIETGRDWVVHTGSDILLSWRHGALACRGINRHLIFRCRCKG